MFWSLMANLPETHTAQLAKDIGDGRGATSHVIGSKLAGLAAKRIEPKMAKLEALGPEEALKQSKHNYTIPASSIVRLYGKYISGSDMMTLYVELNDSTGLWPYRGRRKFIIESDELGDIVNDITECCPYRVEISHVG